MAHTLAALHIWTLKRGAWELLQSSSNLPHVPPNAVPQHICAGQGAGHPQPLHTMDAIRILEPHRADNTGASHPAAAAG